jgi:predicted ATPase
VYGQNGSGKSSAMYAPYVFRNFYVNPNQRLNSLFNLGFMNLGGFENVVKQSENWINVNLLFDLTKFKFDGFKITNEKELSVNLILTKQNEINRNNIELKIDNKGIAYVNFELPYDLQEKIDLENNNELFWNGVTFGQKYDKISGENFLKLPVYNSISRYTKNLEIISVKRGFFNALFNSKQDDDETKLALKIREEGLDFESKIDHYFKQIFDKTFRYVAIPGSDSFYLRTQNKASLTTDLVNEGFGVNQTIYMLIKLLKKDTSLAFIEEPEIHLHPSAQNKLVDIFYDIVEKENKQIFITTHSENIVSTVLARIAEGKIKKEDVNFFLCKNEGGETVYELQEVNDNGQIKGGLLSFMEAELSNLKAMLGV